MWPHERSLVKNLDGKPFALIGVNTNGYDSKKLKEVMDKEKLDVIVAPSGGVAWMTDLVGGDCGVFESSSLAAVAGYPNITVPAGFIQGLPAGISFFGKAFTEHKLIMAAYAFEQATRARRIPKFLTTYAG